MRPNGKLEGVRVLVVEDDADTREVLALGLELSGAKVTAAGTARDALKALEREQPDVLLSDIGLPDEDGLALIRKVRRMPSARGGRTPAAAVTAFTLGDDPNEALRAGYQKHFRKPVETHTLFDAVAELAHGGAVDRRDQERRGSAQHVAVDRRGQRRRDGNGEGGSSAGSCSY